MGQMVDYGFGEHKDDAMTPVYMVKRDGDATSRGEELQVIDACRQRYEACVYCVKIRIGLEAGHIVKPWGHVLGKPVR